MALAFEKYDAEHQKLWDTMKIVRDAKQLDRVATKIKKHQAVYEAVQKDTGVPWQMVAVIHLREAGEGDIGVWKGVIHNGEKIVGTQRKTRLVPAGRGPFKTWHEASVDALKLKKFDQIKNWTLAKMLSALEPYNGYGYRSKGLRSPYLWASTNHQERGKYVADHVFDASVMDTQVGTAAQLRYLGVGVQEAPSAATKTVVTTTPLAATGIACYWQWVVNNPFETAAYVIVTGLIVYGLYKWIGRLRKLNKNG